jgi:subtilase-type serine protease
MFRWLIILLICVLDGCGGGGGGGGGSAPVTNSWQSFNSANSSNVASAADYRTSEYNNDWSLEAIGAAQAYATLKLNGKVTNGAGVTIGVADSALLTTSSEIANNFKTSGNSVAYDILHNISDHPNADINPSVATDGVVTGNSYGWAHGTAVAAIAAGVAGNGGVQGVAYGSQISFSKISVPLVAYPSGVVTNGGSDSNLVASGVKALAQSGSKVVTLSSGWQPVSLGLLTDPKGVDTDYIPLTGNAVYMGMYDAIQQNDVVFTVAAGNDPASPLAYPAHFAAYSEVKGYEIAVASFKSDKTISTYSSYCGVAAAYCITAPGENIYVANFSTSGLGVISPSYVTGSGTSFATPAVAGAAAVQSRLATFNRSANRADFVNFGNSHGNYEQRRS